VNKNKDGSLCLWDKDAFSVLYGQIIRKIEIDSSQSEWTREKLYSMVLMMRAAWTWTITL